MDTNIEDDDEPSALDAAGLKVELLKMASRSARQYSQMARTSIEDGDMEATLSWLHHAEKFLMVVQCKDPATLEPGEGRQQPEATP